MVGKGWFNRWTVVIVLANVEAFLHMLTIMMEINFKIHAAVPALSSLKEGSMQMKSGVVFPGGGGKGEKIKGSVTCNRGRRRRGASVLVIL